MRSKRQFLADEIYFVTIRTVEQRYALDPYACPSAWILADGRELGLDEKQRMRAHGRACVEQMQVLTDAIAEAEQDPKMSRPVVSLEMFTDSIPNIIGSCMARGVEMFGVEIFGYVWMSNHGHLLLRAPKGNFADYMTYVNGQIAVNVNRFLDRKHALWGRRYAAAQVLDEAAELEMLGYLLANPQNAGIADSIEEWAGLSSASFFFEDRKQRFLSFNRTNWHTAGRPQNIAPYLSTTELEHKLLPQLSKLDRKTLRRKIRRLIKKHVKVLPTSEVETEVEPMMSVRRQLLARTVIPTDRPTASKNAPRKYSSRQPLCHTTNPALHRVYRAQRREFRWHYEKSSAAYRSGNVKVIFPPGSFAPSRYPQAQYASDPDAIISLHPTRKNLEMAARLE